MSNAPQPFKSEQYEFNAEQNRTISDLTSAMKTVGTLLSLVTLGFLIVFALATYRAVMQNGKDYTAYGASAGLLAALVLFGSMAFWLSSAAGSFRRIVESQNKDIWHLMNALESLRGMFSLMRLIILGSLVLLAVAVVVHFFNQAS